MPVIWRSGGHAWPLCPRSEFFWLVDNKLVAGSIPWRQADFHGGFYCGKNDHPQNRPGMIRDQAASAQTDMAPRRQ
jgi:hypothetical protein